MGVDSNWPTICEKPLCTDPFLRPHHHHQVGNGIQMYACSCGNIDQPGTRPKEA